MSFRINSNITAMNANLHANLNSKNINQSLASLASGSSLNSASYDASGLGLADQMSARISGMGQAIMNSNDSIGMIQVADGALQEYDNTLNRVRTLTLQASNGTMSDDGRVIIQKEIDALLETADNIANNTSYNGNKLLNGTGGQSGDGTFVTQSGADAGDTQGVTIGDTQVASIVGAIDVTTQTGASNALDALDDASKSIGGIRSDLGAAQNQLISSIKNTSITRINTASAESQIKDVDFAAESAKFSQQNIFSQVGAFVQSQANASQANVMSLLQ